MFGITNRTIILLGGNVTVAASANLSSSASMQGSGNLRVGAAAALSSDYALTGNPNQGQSGRANLNFGSIAAGVGTSYRLAHAAMGATANVTAKGDGTFNLSIEPLTVASELVSAGGIEYQAPATPLAASANMLVVNPGVLYEGGSVTWNLSASMSTTVSPVFRLILPTRQNTFTRHRLFGRYPVETGVALLIKDGVATFSEAPSDNELKDADFYFLGGYRHQITPVERAAIVSAGYAELVEEG